MTDEPEGCGAPLTANALPAARCGEDVTYQARVWRDWFDIPGPRPGDAVGEGTYVLEDRTIRRLCRWCSQQCGLVESIGNLIVECSGYGPSWPELLTANLAVGALLTRAGGEGEVRGYVKGWRECDADMRENYGLD